MIVSRRLSVGNSRNSVSFITGNEIDLLYPAKSRIYMESLASKFCQLGVESLHVYELGRPGANFSFPTATTVLGAKPHDYSSFAFSSSSI